MSENNLCVAHNPWPTCPNCAIEILNTRLDEAKKEIERLKSPQTVIECHRQKRIETLETALAARDVIIGVKDGALDLAWRDILDWEATAKGLRAMDKNTLFISIKGTERGEKESEKIRHKVYQAKSLSPNEVAEAINGVMDVLDWISGGISCVIGETPNEISPMGCINHKHGFSCKASEARILYDKALKGVVSK